MALTECEVAWRDVPARSIVATTLHRCSLLYRDDQNRGTFIWTWHYGWMFNRYHSSLRGAWDWINRREDLVVVVADVDPCLSDDQIKALVSLWTGINTSA